VLRTVGGVLRTLLRPWKESATWWSLVHLSLDMAMGHVTTMFVIMTGVVAVSLVVLLPLSVVVVWIGFLVARGLAQFERSRYAAFLDLDLTDTTPPLQGRNVWRRFVERLRSQQRWREWLYLTFHLPVGALCTVVTVSTWAGSLALAALPLYVGALPGDRAGFGLFEVEQGDGAALAVLSITGLVLFVLAAPRVTLAMARLSAAYAGVTLGWSRRRDMAEQVEQLEASRVAAVDSAEAERRRIERDLHDGAQQRLIAAAMDLGSARERLPEDPEAAAPLVANAHEEVKAAMKEIRDLVRGVHPVVLEDRGLDAALSAVVARSPIPVALSVDVPGRPPPAVESAAYFIVSEALTNVARHSGASRASVQVVRQGDRLVVVVDDDGVGGADPSRGTGLRGLEERVRALGGRFQILSQPGGPTTLIAEVPCAS